MTRVVLVRHGRAAAGWDDDPDPGLDELGAAQARSVADALAALGPLPILTSPLRRCRETAAPLAARWGVDPVIDPAVGEIPSPDGIPMGERVEWLRSAMAGTWTDLGPRYTTWRDSVVERVRAISSDTIVFSHFVAINTVVGAALGDDRVLVLRLDNTSRTAVNVEPDGTLTLIEGGHEADTQIR